MINKSMKDKLAKGFTITELLVATAVFAGVLLLAVLGFTQIGRLFYKGVTVSQTRQTATQIIDAVSGDIRLTTSYTPTTYLCNSICAGGATTLTAYCIGNHIYVANLNNRVNLASSSHDFVNNFGLMQGQLSAGNCAGTGTGGAFTSSDLAGDKPAEMLGDDMRLTNFIVTPNPTVANSYSVSVAVAYGEDSVFNNLGNPIPSCKGVSTGSQFCSVISLNATVSNRPTLGQ